METIQTSNPSRHRPVSVRAAPMLAILTRATGSRPRVDIALMNSSSHGVAGAWTYVLNWWSPGNLG